MTPPAAEPRGTDPIREILAEARERPAADASVAAKAQYAIRFADAFAKRIGKDLSSRLRGIRATPARSAASVRGHKQLDVNFSTPQQGLALGISLKSVHLRDVKSGRYTHNMKRNEEELRVEASGYHKRQPYAVMVGVLILPFDACEDAKRDNPSSMGSWVRHLRPYTGRLGPEDDIDRFEKIYLALYEPDGSDLRFVDVEADPPKNRRPRADGPLLGPDGRPRRVLTYSEFLAAIYERYLHRNSAQFRWDDGEDDPLEVEEPAEGDEDDPT